MFVIQVESIPQPMKPRICGFHGKKGFTLNPHEAVLYKTAKGAEKTAMAVCPDGFRYKINQR